MAGFPRALLAAAVMVLLLPAGLLRASGTPAEKCAAAKNKTAAKKANSKLKCYQKAIATGTAVSSTCLMAAEMKFDAAIMKAESKGGCAITGDGPTLEALVDKQTSDMVSFTPTALPVCCSNGSGGACYYGATVGDCLSPFTAGPANTVCDGASGACTAPPATPGLCCSNPAGIPATCFAGPENTQSHCSGSGGTTSDSNALCSPVPGLPASATGSTCVRF